MAAELPALLKRTALARWPRSEVAALHGDAWLAWLDAAVGGDRFTAGPGRRLLDLAYAAPRSANRPDATQLADLLATVRHWIRKHRGPKRSPAVERRGA